MDALLNRSYGVFARRVWVGMILVQRMFPNASEDLGFVSVDLEFRPRRIHEMEGRVWVRRGYSFVNSKTSERE